MTCQTLQKRLLRCSISAAIQSSGLRFMSSGLKQPLHLHRMRPTAYGSRGVAQAKKIKEQTSALFAGGELSKEDQANFIKEMEALFLDAKEESKKFTLKKYL